MIAFWEDLPFEKRLPFEKISFQEDWLPFKKISFREDFLLRKFPFKKISYISVYTYHHLSLYPYC